MVVLLVAGLFSGSTTVAKTVDFEDLTLASESYWNGSDGSGGFVSRGATFNNNYDMEWDSWDGFAYSNLTDTMFAGFDAQYNAIPGSGARGSKIYAVAYVSTFAADPPTITLEKEKRVTGAYFTNTNYAYYSMRDGDDFAKKFTADDRFTLTITGINAAGLETGTVEFNLADGRNIVNNWTWVDLSGLGSIKQLTFSLSSTDMEEWGMNTPAYFCLDHLDKNLDDDDSTCFINTIRY